uniref:Ribosomal protein S1 n=1 Tax=Synarthrophyton chejuense TaxID=2485825 RepID=A0A3G3MFS8_9FLOR|nr:ribosomal protein S1 [Synarthrophyton chejuense]AYR05681.1 ribosomal protein S1 [Synarthrophyton chejuense]
MKNKTSNQSGFTHKDFASVLNKYNYNLNLGDITAGTIFSKEKEGFLVDIGSKIAAYLPKDEMIIYQKNFDQQEMINETREFFILAYNKKSEQLILSIKRLEYIRAWERIKQMEKEDIKLKLIVHEINKGGLLTLIEGIQGFIPNSHIVNIRNKNLLMNQNIECQFLLINEKSNKLILSNKRAILTKLSDTIYIGQITKGIVSKIESYGTFLIIYGINALLHISEIKKKEKQDTHTQLKIGDQVEVKIIHIDKKQGRLSVSQKNL